MYHADDKVSSVKIGNGTIKISSGSSASVIDANRVLDTATGGYVKEISTPVLTQKFDRYDQRGNLVHPRYKSFLRVPSLF
jgi:hypothetical protein